MPGGSADLLPRKPFRSLLEFEAQSTTLPFGTPDEGQAQLRERLAILGKGCGFVYNPMHNVRASTPIENLLAMCETAREYSQND